MTEPKSWPIGVAQRPIAVPLGINLVETNTGRPIEPDAVVAELASALAPFVGRADYIAFNLNCPNTTGGVSPFTSGGHLRDLLRECAAIDDLPPVFLKLTAHTDPARLRLDAGDGRSFLLSSRASSSTCRRERTIPLKSPAHLVGPLPGTLCGRPVQALIDETVRFWYGRIDRQRHAIIGVGGISSARDAYRKIRLGLRWCSYTQRWSSGGRVSCGKSTRGWHTCWSAMDLPGWQTQSASTTKQKQRCSHTYRMPGLICKSTRASST